MRLENQSGYGVCVSHPWESRLSLIDDPHDRAERAATNQSLFREINERVRDLNTGFAVVLPMSDWVCECSNATCIERVAMSVVEYETVRNEAGRFLVAPSDEHVWHDIEAVVGRNDRYWVVAKSGAAAN